jgi:hypothetical protein
MSMPKIVLQPIDREIALSNVIASIALEEAALSHVLNAEGEKIQKAVAMSAADSTTVGVVELTLINTSVAGMVDGAAEIEAALHEKLQTAIDAIDPGWLLPRGTLTFTLVDDSENPIETGTATFTITGIRADTGGTWTKIVKVDLEAKLGVVTIDKIIPGTYTLTQNTAPIGYDIDQDPYAVTVNTDGATASDLEELPGTGLVIRNEDN